MGQGFSEIAAASAVLFGLVLVAIEFAFNSALSKAGKIRELRDFAWWVWSTGFYCCLCYMYCFLVSMHLIRGKYSYAALVIITAVASVLMVATKVVEILYMYRMSRTDWKDFRKLFIADTIIALVVFPAVIALIWIAVLGKRGDVKKYEMLFTALKYLLVVVSIRAVVLIGLAFQAIVNFEQIARVAGLRDCPYCGKSIPKKATRCPYCCSDLPEELDSGSCVGSE